MTQPDAGGMINFAPLVKKYAGYPGNATRVYHMLCDVLADRASQVDWGTFTPDDWRMILPMAEAEGVAPLLWWKLRAWGTQSDTEAFPAGVRTLVTALAPAYYETLAHNTLLLQALERILKAFQEAGIEVIVLKGAALAQTVYEDIGLRPMNDLDLLVRPKSLRKAVKVLQGLGFAPLKHHYLGYQFLIVSENVSVELHWDIPDREGEQKLLWSQTQSLPPWMKSVFTLNTGAQIVHLAVHAFWQHRAYLRLIWLYDLHLLVKEYKWADWQALLQTSEVWGRQQALFNALTVLKVCFQDDVPDTTSMRRIPAGDSGVTLTWDKFVKVWQILDWKFRLNMIIQGLFPPSGYLRRRYSIRHPFLIPFYYVYRWFDLFNGVFRA